MTYFFAGFYGNTYKAEYKISADKDPSQVTIKVLQGKEKNNNLFN